MNVLNTNTADSCYEEQLLREREKGENLVFVGFQISDFKTPSEQNVFSSQKMTHSQNSADLSAYSSSYSILCSMLCSDRLGFLAGLQAFKSLS